MFTYFSWGNSEICFKGKTEKRKNILKKSNKAKMEHRPSN